MSAGVISPTRARACLVLAAVLWSLGSVFMRLLREPLGLGLDTPQISPLQIAFFRGLFGGLVMLALVRRADIHFRPKMLGMVVAFTVMSGLYLSALGLGAAANAIFLQNTAPVWVYLFAVLILREAADRRGIQAVFLAVLGAVVIVAGGWPRNSPPEQARSEVVVLFMGVGSGVVYAMVVIFLRVLRDQSTAWLVALNLLGTAVTLGLYVLATAGPTGFVAWVTAPSLEQLVVLVLFGVFQMALPYWLFTRGLRAVSSQEAAIITLIEPLLNPVWAYLITPEKDTPTPAMLLGGGLILFALIWRYVPTRKEDSINHRDTMDTEKAERREKS
jgi:drug/metabolite transporter (DMT)-like permease